MRVQSRQGATPMAKPVYRRLNLDPEGGPLYVLVPADGPGNRTADHRRKGARHERGESAPDSEPESEPKATQEPSTP